MNILVKTPAVLIRLTAFVLCCLMLLGRSASGQTRIEMVDEATLPRFEVASIKRASNGPPRAEATPGRFLNENMPLFNAVSLAFDIPLNQFATPLPPLMGELFTIDARM